MTLMCLTGSRGLSPDPAPLIRLLCDEFALLFAAVLLTAGFAAGARAADAMELPALKAVVSCDQLAKVDLGKTAGTAVTFTAAVLQTPKGSFCRVAGDVEPGNSFEINLPIEHWTQRYVQSAQGNIAINNAGSCAPATNGEVVVGVNSRGGSRRREGWQTDPQKRIAFAYLLNHQTALMAKHLIKVFYGQAQRFSYFTGCSGGGREVLIEAQRYPEDFDGIASGAPAILLNVHNGGFYHGWEPSVNQRADGSIILARERVSILHDAAIAHCAKAADAMDGILQMPTACQFDPAWVRCPAGAADISQCLNAEETAVAQKLYQGSSDNSGRGFDMGGFPLGSEKLWALSKMDSDVQSRTGSELQYLLSLPEANQSAAALDAAFQFNQEWFDKVGVLAPLYNGADTNLRAFQQRGGKLLLWQGAADATVQQQSTIAYYQGVQQTLGTQSTDSFLRLFLLPGVGHCSGGDGPAQIDVLSPLMAWVEQQRQPEMIVAGKTANQRNTIPGEGVPGAANAGPRSPYAAAAQPVVLKRPVYPFPNIARYDGKGDKNDPASYQQVKSSVKTPQVLDSRATKLIGPDNHYFYKVENGRLVAEKAALKGPIRLDSGLVSGGSAGDRSLTAFWSLPYAAPPVGDLRWRPPAPVRAWQGVRPADHPGNQCPSAQQGGESSDPVVRSEDCLNVDVVTGAASASERRPVMVWFHGGLRGLGGSLPTAINGAELAKKGAVVVSVNYRGGPFGLLALPALSQESGHNASGNYALMDDIAALKWIQRNIAAFGGDPRNVTIIGESFGAATCHFLSMSPLAKGLFQRMITESHSLYPRDPTMMEVAARYKLLQDAEADGARFMQIAGAKTLAELRALSTEQLMEAFRKSGQPEDFLWSYVVDGYVLPRNFSATYAAQAQVDVSVLTGENRDENRATADTAFDLVAAGKAQRPNPATAIGFRGLNGYREYAKTRFGTMADEFLTLYPATDDREAFFSANASIRDNQRISPWTWATSFTAKRDKPAYLYFFTHAPPGPNREMSGAYHGAEIDYAFNNAGAAWADEDRRIADMMSSYWVNFARTGNPNGTGLPNWAAFDGKTEQTMELGDHFQAIPLADNVKLDFWRRFYATQPAR